MQIAAYHGLPNFASLSCWVALDDDKLIGSCQLIDICQTHKNAELVIRIGDTSEWGKGYGKEAIKLLCEYGFEVLHLHKVFLKVFTSNKRAISTYEACGFEVEGKLMQHAYVRNKWQDMLLMAKIKNA